MPAVNERTFGTERGLDIQEELTKISSPVVRKTLKTEDGEKTYRDAIIRRDTGQSIGIVAANHPTLNYGDLTKWLIEQLESLNLRYKLRESQIMKQRGDLYQEFILDQAVDTPDKSNMAPLIIARASYIGVPYRLDMGTYRFVCSNGALIGTTLSTIKITANSGQDVLRSSITSDIRANLERFRDISHLYTQLETEDGVSYLNMLLFDFSVSTTVKVAILEMLKQDGTVEIVKANPTKNDFQKPENVVTVQKPFNAWQLYNTCTYVASHKIRGSGTKTRVDNRIATLFNV